MDFFNNMMITYHPHMKIIDNLKIVVFEIFEIQNIISECSNFKSHLLDVNGS
jgi:hypothetical protein